ncbi:hypothetical protein VPH35_044361 [Triticum aestivum]|uniref:Uncharacterized protein n=1 Tax=Triticum aestivum TaxID=4565 RepID=A0A3B6EJ26_WHEAT
MAPPTTSRRPATGVVAGCRPTAPFCAIPSSSTARSAAIASHRALLLLPHSSAAIKLWPVGQLRRPLPRVVPPPLSRHSSSSPVASSASCPSRSATPAAPTLLLCFPDHAAALPPSSCATTLCSSTPTLPPAMTAEGHLAPAPLPRSIRSQACRHCPPASPSRRRSGHCVFFTSCPSPYNSPGSCRPLPAVSNVPVHLRVLLPLTPSRTTNE